MAHHCHLGNMAVIWCRISLDLTHLAVSGSGHVASKAGGRKRLKCSGYSASYCFIPVSVNTVGARGVDATDFNCQLARRIATVTGDRTDKEFLLQRFSVDIQRNNATAVVETA